MIHVAELLNSRKQYTVLSAIPFVFRRRETTNPVPAKVFLKVSPGIAMLFSQPACAQEEKQLTQCQPRSFKGEPRHGHAVSQPICAQEERNDPPSANQGLSKGEPRHGHVVFSTHLCTGRNGTLSANQGLFKGEPRHCHAVCCTHPPPPVPLFLFTQCSHRPIPSFC